MLPRLEHLGEVLHRLLRDTEIVDVGLVHVDAIRDTGDQRREQAIAQVQDRDDPRECRHALSSMSEVIARRFEHLANVSTCLLLLQSLISLHCVLMKVLVKHPSSSTPLRSILECAHQEIPTGPET